MTEINMKLAAAHAVHLEQCSLFVDSEPLKRAMTDAATFLRAIVTPVAVPKVEKDELLAKWQRRRKDARATLAIKQVEKDKGHDWVVACETIGCQEIIAVADLLDEKHPSDYVTHHDAFRKACEMARDASKEEADEMYWQHQIDTLDNL